MRKVVLFWLIIRHFAAGALNTDSLLNRLKQELPDTERVNVLNVLSYEKYLNDIVACKKYSRQALDLAKKINYTKGTIIAYLYHSYAVKSLGEIDEGLKLVDSGLALCKTPVYDVLKVKLYNQLGNIYGDQGDISKSLSYYIMSSKLSEKLNDKKTLLGAYANIGICFMSNKQFDKSKEYLRKAIWLSDETTDLKNKGNIFNNLGAIYMEENLTDSALYYFKHAELLFLKADFKRGLGYCYYYIGFTMQRAKDYKGALQYFLRSSDIFTESNNVAELPNIYNCIAEVYLQTKRPQLAVPYARKALEESLREKSYYDIKEAYKVMKEVYEQAGDYKTALMYHEKYVKLNDSLFDTQSTAQMAEMQAKYETGRKDAENKLLQEKNDSNAKTIRQQRYFGFAVGFICILLIAFAVVIFRSNKQKQRTNLELERKNLLIERQKELVEEKQKEILDSIHYAKRIQRSLLASESYIYRKLNHLRQVK